MNAGEVLGGRYRLEALIGAGGMASVYRGYDLRLERPVAVKVLAPNLALDETLSQRFSHEGRSLAAMRHPAIVDVYDVGEADGDPFLVMELVDGESLAERLAREGALPSDVAAPILGTVAAGLAALHEQGFVHRDVKPHNVLVDRAGRAKLADFGLVRGLGSPQLTVPGTMVGTLAYLAPELLRGEDATPATDVYALAVVAYQTLTGRLPFPADTLAGLVEAQAAPAPLPSTVAPWLGTRFDEILDRALGEPARRPSAAELAARLEAAGRGNPGGAGSDGSRAALLAPVVAGGTFAAGGADPEAVTRPVPVGAGARPDGRVTPGRARPRRARAGTASLLVGSLLGLALLAVLLGGLGLLGAGPSPSGPAAARSPRAAAAAATGTPRRSTPTPRPTPAPTPAPTPMPTPAPQVDPLAGLVGAVDRYEAAVAAARGGEDGLRGNEARNLIDAARQVVEDARRGDLEQARQRAQELVDRTQQVTEELDGGREALVAAAESVQAEAARLEG